MSYGLSLTTVPKDLYYVERKLVADQAAEIERLRAVVEAAERWRRAYHHGVREEQDLQERCLLDAVCEYQQQPAEK